MFYIISPILHPFFALKQSKFCLIHVLESYCCYLVEFLKFVDHKPEFRSWEISLVQILLKMVPMKRIP
jgi:D-alanyl-lipoteichoic acid acyltransferase DltB (MBOAT superfamily)